MVCDLADAVGAPIGDSPSETSGWHCSQLQSDCLPIIYGPSNGFLFVLEEPHKRFVSSPKHSRWIVPHTACKLARQRKTARDSDKCHADALESPSSDCCRKKIGMLGGAFLKHYGPGEVDQNMLHAAITGPCRRNRYGLSAFRIPDQAPVLEQ